MKIIIVGAGRIGTNLSKSLAEENNEVYLVENKTQKAGKIADKLDVKVVVGNGADPDTLKSLQVAEADLVLAVTTTDETNLVVCSLAASFGAKRCIARVRNTSLGATISEFGYKKFGVDEIINPELVAAQSIAKTIKTPGASEVADFADGKIFLRGFDVPKTSPLCGSKLSEFRDDDFPWPFLIVSLIREEKVFVPTGDDIIQEGDHIYALLPAPSLGEFLTFVNPEIKMPKKIIIYGATITGWHVAKTITDNVRDVILIEENEELAKKVAGELESVRVTNGAPTAEILTECGVEAADVFIATSNNDHSNLISSVLAKKMGAHNTIITTQQPDYLSIVHALDIDAIINPQFLAVEQILRLARGERVSSVTKILECDAEALELKPDQDALITRHKIKDLKIPKGSIVGAVHNSKGACLVNGETLINAGEKVIVFGQNSPLKKLQEMFKK